jgi:hypothetical protein
MKLRRRPSSARRFMELLESGLSSSGALPRAAYRGSKVSEHRVLPVLLVAEGGPVPERAWLSVGSDELGPPRLSPVVRQQHQQDFLAPAPSGPGGPAAQRPALSEGAALVVAQLGERLGRLCEHCPRAAEEDAVLMANEFREHLLQHPRLGLIYQQALLDPHYGPTRRAYGVGARLELLVLVAEEGDLGLQVLLDRVGEAAEQILAAGALRAAALGPVRFSVGLLARVRL